MDTMEIAVLTVDNELFNQFRRSIRLCMEPESVSPMLYQYASASVLIRNLKTESRFDVVFLDMQTENNSYQMMKKLTELVPAPILIPLYGKDDSINRLLRLQPFRLIPRESFSSELGECIRAILRDLPNTVHHPYLILKSGNSLVRIPVSRIRYLESTNRQLLIAMESGEITLKCTIGNVEQLLEDYHFLRIHKSYLVNAHCVVSLERDEVHLTDGKVLPLSRYRSEEVHSRFREIFQADTV